MPSEIQNSKTAQRVQQRAQEHLNYQTANHFKRQRPDVTRDIFAHTPAIPVTATGARRRCAPTVNARTVLTAGTFLALLTGGQAAAALVDAPFAAAAAISPVGLNRRARRMLAAASEEPIKPSAPPSVPLQLVQQMTERGPSNT